MSTRKNTKRNTFPAWHPDFRVAEDLPDIKVVRTDFLINIGAVGLALMIFIWLAYREATVYGLENDISTLQAEQSRLEGDNMIVVASNTRFMKRKQIFDDLDKFYDIPVDVPRFLADLARLRPSDISFEEVAYQELQQTEQKVITRTYRIFLRGQTRSLQLIDDLKESLIELPYLQNVDDISEGSNPRNPTLNTFGFSIEVRFKQATEKASS